MYIKLYRLSTLYVTQMHENVQEHCSIVIDYRDYVYGIGNECTPPIVMCKDLVKGHLSKSFVESIDKEPKDSQRRLSLVGL